LPQSTAPESGPGDAVISDALIVARLFPAPLRDEGKGKSHAGSAFSRGGFVKSSTEIAFLTWEKWKPSREIAFSTMDL